MYIYQTVKPRRPVHKTSRLWMRVRHNDWWDVVLLHFKDDESKENSRSRSMLVPCVIRHYAISKSMHTLSTLQFRFSMCFVQVFICPLNRITKVINYPLQTELNFNQIWQIHSD